MATTGIKQSSLSIICAGVLSVSALTPATAAQFGVRVVDMQGNPMEGAAVCVGLPGNSRQFGAAFTNAEGTAVLDVPPVPLQVTVSKNRFTGVRLSEPARQYNLIRQITLIDGVPGPRCNAGSALTDADIADVPSLLISRVDVQTNAGRTTIEPITDGQPTHYRLVDDPAFLDFTDWERLTGPISLSGRQSSDRPLYLQVRHYEGSSRGYLEAVSNVITLRLTTLN